MFFLIYAFLTGTATYLGWLGWHESTILSIMLFGGVYVAFVAIRYWILRAQEPSYDDTGGVVGDVVDFVSGFFFGAGAGIFSSIGSWLDSAAHEEECEALKREFSMSVLFALLWTIGIAVWAAIFS
ncbi:MAG TPA: hypothetical protein PKA37_18755 [Planctomycetota bacterium]|nr:hypothetical protein [Planctomycetota bacterium]